MLFHDLQYCSYDKTYFKFQFNLFDAYFDMQFMDPKHDYFSQTLLTLLLVLIIVVS